MADFKKGDWVRALVDWSDTVAGDVMRVARVQDNGVWCIDRIGEDSFMSNSEVEPWTPKVGERVRVTEKANSAWAGEGEVTAIHPGFGTHSLSMQTGCRAGNSGDFLLNEIEPLSVAAEAKPAAPVAEPLTIQAGKFYKTRDGRKVGPMKYNDLGSGFSDISKTLTSQKWNADGRYIIGTTSPLDLIAEWQEHVDITAATIDAINDEYGPVAREVPVPKQKFKVGDRVLVTCNKTNGGFPIVKYIIGEVYKVTSIVPDLNGNDAALLNGHYQYLKHSQFTLMEPAIVCLIDNSRPLPATRPRVHDSVEAADKEAARLASVHKGQEFGVFSMTGTPHKVEKTYEHEWQRLADQGKRADAEKELRRITGMSHSLARYVVSNRAA